MFQRTFLTGLAATLLVVQACGSDSPSKRVRSGEDAGAGGEAGAAGPGPDSGGSSAGAEQGTAGEPGPTAGTGTIPTDGGAGGQPPLPEPEPEFLFVVRGDALGLADTTLEGQTNKQNVIYTTGSASNEDVDGDNAVKVVGTDLGLDAADAIIAFAELQPEPQNPLYSFTVTDGSEGGVPTTVNNQDIVGEPKGGDVFFSDGTESYRYRGEGGDQYGFNGLLFTETSLGLSRGIDEGPPDELHDILGRDANRPLRELYFTVNGDASGAEDSAVEATPDEQRGCTVFKSGLDGTNTVAFTCDDLGLADDDQIDALVVYGTSAPTQVVFSVTAGSQGAAGSAVTAASLTYEGTGAPLFSSSGNGTNKLAVSAPQLGLGYWGDNDDIDGLTVVDAPQARVQHAASCTADHDPFAGDGQLVSYGGILPLGSNIAVLVGRTDTTARAIAYDVESCELVQQKDLTASELEQASGMVIVRLTGWSAATPLDDIEYVRPGATDDMLEIHRFDEAGAFIKAVPFTNLYYYDSIAGLMHEPTSNRLFVLTNGSYYGYQLELSVIDMPTDDTTDVTASRIRLGTPCGTLATIFGVEASGNITLAQYQSTGGYYRVCSYSELGTLLPSPSWWTPQTTPEDVGFIANGRSFFSVTTDEGPGISIERGTLTAP